MLSVRCFADVAILRRLLELDVCSRLAARTAIPSMCGIVGGSLCCPGSHTYCLALLLRSCFAHASLVQMIVACEIGLLIRLRLVFISCSFCSGWCARLVYNSIFCRSFGGSSANSQHIPLLIPSLLWVPWWNYGILSVKARKPKVTKELTVDFTTLF